MPTQILMPALSPTMEEGKLAKWFVKEGDSVKSGDILAEIETDKATMEFEAIDEGTIAKLLVAEGTEGVKVNAAIAILAGEGEDPKAAAAAAPDTKSGAPRAPSGTAGGAQSAPSASAKPGSAPSAPSADAGAEKSRNRPGTDNLHKDDLSNDHQSTNVQQTDGRDTDRPVTDDRVFASPLAKRMAKDSGIALSALRGSGPRGRIVKADVEAAASSFEVRRARAPHPSRLAPLAPHPSRLAPLAPQDDGLVPARHPEVAAQPPSKGDARLFFAKDGYEEIPHDSMRRTIARRLTSATTLIPHFYLTVDCDIGGLLDARKRLNAKSPEGNGAYKLSVNDFLVKAAALALMRVPEVNASWTDTAILRHRHANVGVAVALDFGLITPIVFRADEKGLVQISNEVKSLAERARAKKLKPAEFEGGTFAISNLGMFGIRDFTAVINPPHAAILAVGAGEERAVVRDGEIVKATIMTVTMSCDHRVIDGATGARFLDAFKRFVEEPAAMLL